MPSLLASRTRYVLFALATIVIGLGVHYGARGFPLMLRDVLGDALWAAMIVWWIGALALGAQAHGLRVLGV